MSTDYYCSNRNAEPPCPFRHVATGSNGYLEPAFTSCPTCALDGRADVGHIMKHGQRHAPKTRDPVHAQLADHEVRLTTTAIDLANVSARVDDLPSRGGICPQCRAGTTPRFDGHIACGSCGWVSDAPVPAYDIKARLDAIATAVGHLAVAIEGVTEKVASVLAALVGDQAQGNRCLECDGRGLVHAGTTPYVCDACNGTGRAL